MRALLVSALLSSLPVLAAEPLAPQCQPFTLAPEPVDVPPAQRAKCGDGALGPYTASCTRTCGGGCGRGVTCGAPQCVTATEPCDGANLNRETCEAMGFFGGELRCASNCTAFVIDDCVPCKAPAGARCAFGPVESVLTPGETPLVSGTKDAVAFLWRTRTEQLVFAMATKGKLVVAPSWPHPGSWHALASDGVASFVADSDGAWVTVRRFEPDGKMKGEAWKFAGRGALHLALLPKHLVVLVDDPTEGVRMRFFDRESLKESAPPPGQHHALTPSGRLLLTPVDTGPTGADQAAVFTDGKVAGTALFKKSQPFGANTARGLEGAKVELRFGGGTLTMTGTAGQWSDGFDDGHGKRFGREGALGAPSKALADHPSRHWPFNALVAGGRVEGAVYLPSSPAIPMHYPAPRLVLVVFPGKP